LSRSSAYADGTSVRRVRLVGAVSVIVGSPEVRAGAAPMVAGSPPGTSIVTRGPPSPATGGGPRVPQVLPDWIQSGTWGCEGIRCRSHLWERRLDPEPLSPGRGAFLCPG